MIWKNRYTVSNSSKHFFFINAYLVDQRHFVDCLVSKTIHQHTVAEVTFYCKLAYQAQLGKESVLLLLCLYFFGGFLRPNPRMKGEIEPIVIAIDEKMKHT